VAYTSNQKDLVSRPAWAKSKTLSQKYPTHMHKKEGEGAGEVVQVVECLPSKYKALSSEFQYHKKIFTKLNSK
jgi:ribosomal protein S17